MNKDTLLKYGLGIAVLIVLYIVIKRMFIKPDLTKIKAFSPLLWRKYKDEGKAAMLLTTKMADAIAGVIYESKGKIYDSDSDVFSYIEKNIKAQTQMSFVSERFSIRYKTSMSIYMDYLDKETLRRIADFVKKLPEANI